MNITLLAIQIINITIIILWLVLAITALRRMPTIALSESQKLVWTLIILLIPILGALVFLISHPTAQPPITSWRYDENGVSQTKIPSP